MTIIDKLSFVTNMAYWSVYFRSGIVEMSLNDWKLIERAVEHSVEPVSVRSGGITPTDS